jgi:acetylglutamate kinase
VHQRHAARDDLELVHGGGPEIGQLHERLGISFRKHHGLRVTTEKSMPIVTMVLCGLVNKRIVARLVAAGLPAVGLSGVDLGLLTTQFLNREDLGRVGGPPRVDTGLLRELLKQRRIPVLAPVCLGPDGAPTNVNADTVAHAIAAAMSATELEFLSDVPGVRMPHDGTARHLSPRRVERLLASTAIRGGMIPKLQAALAAVDAGIERVRIGNLDTLMENTATEIH